MNRLHLKLIWTVLFFVAFAWSANLRLIGKKDKIIENQDFEIGIISGSENITIKNCTFTLSGDEGDVLLIDEGSKNIKILDCDLNGNLNACRGIRIYEASYVDVERCKIYDLADDGAEIKYSHHINFLNNTVHTAIGKGTDGNNSKGPCVNGHSDLIEFCNSSDAVFDGNLFYNAPKINAVIFLAGCGKTNVQGCTNLRFTNNIIYAPNANKGVCFEYADNIEFYNNVVWGSEDGIILRIGDKSPPGWLRNVKIYNNILSSLEVGKGVKVTNDYNLVSEKYSSHSLGAHSMENSKFTFTGIGTLNSSVVEEVTADMFRLPEGSKAIGAGTTGNGFPEHDFNGNPFSTPRDLGAFVFDSGETSSLNTRPEANAVPLVTYNNVTRLLHYVCPGTDAVTLQIIDPRGRSFISKKQMATGEGSLYLGKSLKPGIYFISVSSKVAEYQNKIVVH